VKRGYYNAIAINGKGQSEKTGTVAWSRPTSREWYPTSPKMPPTLNKYSLDGTIYLSAVG
jgi:hypothetical protein